LAEHQETLLLRHTQLVVHWTDGSRETFRLGERTRVGRGRSGNDIAVPDTYQSVSRQHLEIRREKDGYRLIDLGSRNGVLVNGIYAKDMYLRNGDEIRIGQDEKGQQIRMEFQLGSEALVSQIATEAYATTPSSTSLAAEELLNRAYLKIRWHTGKISYFSLQKDKILIGRSSEADLRIPETLGFVSSRHAEILETDAGFVIRDLNSTNGTLLNNQPLEPDHLYLLGNEAIIRLGDDEYGVSVGMTFIHPASQARGLDGFLQSAPATEIAKVEQVLIGRLPNCDLVLDHPEVSRKHALVRRRGDRYLLEDLDSSNGTYLNDKPIKQAELQEGDLIQIGKFLLLFQGGQLVPYTSSGMRVDAARLSKDVRSKGGKRRILDNVNLSVLPCEFIALVGGSGAGKSTLLNALIGIGRGEGQVKLNGHDFYREYERFRAQLGYVPQSDILHPSLTVEKAMEYAARLRLPANLTPGERKSRIDAVLETVSMNRETIRRTRISNLSGGQQKRVSIAAELLADPKLIYLDEATSGLDPGLEKKMIHTLRRMADEGRTVVLVTHATNNIVQTDHIAFLSEGKLVYFGPSEEALSFFEVDDFADIYERIDHKGDEWRQIFEVKKPAQYRKYVQERQKSLTSAPTRALNKTGFGSGDFFQQLLVLPQRSLSVLFSDPVTLFLMLLLFPIIATLQLVIARPDILTGNLSILADPVAAAQTMTASYTPFPYTNTFVFMSGLEAVLTGMFVPLNELVKERSIFLRERMVGLKVLPYLWSKVFIYGVFAFIQVVLYLIILSLGVDIPEKGLYFNGYLEMFITLYLAMLAGIGFGLIISAVSKSTEMAIYILTMMLFFQFFFAGAIFDLRGNRFEPLSYLSTTRWALTALGVTVDMNQITESTILCNDAPEDPLAPNGAKKTVCFNYPEAKDDLRLPYDDAQLGRSWAALIGMMFLFFGITWVLLIRQGWA
jgi:ABC-type multidrug transport system ATPase subunit/pSer/pThr/pTyr-binding forkhead associated (FHA) protein